MARYRLWLPAFLIVTGLARCDSAQAATKTTGAKSLPAALVQDALKSELAGKADERRDLLEQAIEQDPNFAPARWQLGYVRIGNEWLKVGEASIRRASDGQLAGYRKLRDSLVDTAENHKTLARYCRKNKLATEERIHWAKVLEFDRNDAEAIAALGLQWYDGRLLTRGQIDEAKARAGDKLRVAQQWHSKLTKWRAAIENGNPKQMDDALRGLKELKDPDVIPSLEATFAENRDAPKTTALNLALVETVSRMPQPEATQVLLRRAVMSDSQEVRSAAADALKNRPMHAYVPQLIAAMPGKLKTRFQLFVLPGGMVAHQHEVVLEGQDAELAFNLESVTQPTDAIMAMFVTPRAANLEARKAAAIEARAQSMQQRAEFVRGRVQAVLERTTGFASADNPDLWKKYYNDYEGWETPQPYRPKYTQSVEGSQTYSSAPTNSTTILTNPPPHNCFPRGTPVMTDNGLIAIEQIKMGDQILAQDTASGELAFKPVQACTLRPAKPMIKLSLGSDEVLATPGHPFWVSGAGWRSAKHIKAGDRLHGIHGFVEVTGVEDSRPSEAYNLVVSELHDYFVGQSLLLVHDNSPLLSDGTVVPGLTINTP